MEKEDSLGVSVWVEAVQDLETAKLRIKELAKNSSAQYFIFSQETQEIVSDKGNQILAGLAA